MNKAMMTIKRGAQRGVTMVEAAATLAIMAAMMMGLNVMANQYLNNSTALTAAQQVNAVGQAAQPYIKDNYGAIVAAATATVPAVIPVSALTNYASGLQQTNAYGQTMCVLVLQPSAGNLTALVVSTGGTTIDDITLGAVAGGIGAAGGGVYSSATTTMRGTMNGWSLAVGNFASANKLCSDGATAGTIAIAAGHPVMALWFTNNSLATNVLYRDAIPGHPELNTINTPLILNSVQTVGSACTTTAAVAADSTGRVVSCQGSKWAIQGSSYWQDPVSNYATLTGGSYPCSATTAWQTRVVQTPSVGSGPRVYTCNGSSWQALGVDDNGNLTVAGTLTANTINASGTVTNSGTTNLNGAVNLNVTATEGAACSGNGMAQNGAGLLLSCQSGIWVSNRSCAAWGGDLNYLEGQPGSSQCINGAGLGNAPSGDWYFVEIMRHYNAGNYYAIQRATGMTGGVTNQVFQRSQQSGSAGSGWSAWVRTDAGGTSLKSIANSFVSTLGVWANAAPFVYTLTNTSSCSYSYPPFPICPAGYTAIGYAQSWINYNCGDAWWITTSAISQVSCKLTSG